MKTELEYLHEIASLLQQQQGLLQTNNVKAGLPPNQWKDDFDSQVEQIKNMIPVGKMLTVPFAFQGLSKDANYLLNANQDMPSWNNQNMNYALNKKVPFYYGRLQYWSKDGGDVRVIAWDSINNNWVLIGVPQSSEVQRNILFVDVWSNLSNDAPNDVFITFQGVKIII